MSARLRNMVVRMWETVWRNTRRAQHRTTLTFERAAADERKWARASARARFWTELREGEREAAARAGDQ